MEGNKSPGVVIMIVVMMVVITVAIVLRLWSRSVTVHSPGARSSAYWWDDWCALGAVPFALATYSVALAWVHYGGLGKHIETLSASQLTIGLKLLYGGQLFQNASLVLSRVSVLFFYLRVSIGGRSKAMLNAILCAMVLSILYFVTICFCSIFACTPVKKAWAPLTPGTCIKTSTYWFWYAIASVIVDFVILLIPMPMLWNLQLKQWRRLSMILLFAGGYCVLATALGRAISIHIARVAIETDPTYGAVPTLYWFILEPTLAVLSVSLPAIFSLAKRAVYYGPKSLFSSKSGTASYNGPRSIPRFGGTKRDKKTLDSNFERLDDTILDPSHQDYVAMVGIGSSKPNSVSDEEPGQFIQVRREYDVTSAA